MAARLAVACALIALVAASTVGCSDDGTATSATRGKAHRHADARPNIIVITADDQTFEMFNRRTMPRTFRLLVDHGTTFSDFIATTPLCCPARASLLTGQYGHNHRVLRNQAGNLRDPENVLPEWLRIAGYRTAHLGKYLNGYEDVLGSETDSAPGWDDWFTLLDLKYYGYDVATGERTRHFGNEPSDYVTSVLTDHAVSWLDQNLPRRRPVYLQLDEFAPHGDANPNCGYAPIPAPGDEGLFQHAGLPEPPSFNEPATGDKSELMRSLPRLDEAKRHVIAERYRCTLATLRGLDRSVASVFHALRKSGELGNTMVVFWSDNGYYFGEHRIPVEKQFPYEEGIHLPLAIRMPSDLARAAPSEIDEPVANIDLAPTIIDLAGARPCLSASQCRMLDGRSLLPLLRGRHSAWPARRPLTVEIGLGNNHGAHAKPCNYTAVRVAGRILIRYTSVAPTGEPCRTVYQYEYYDLNDDPHQLENIYDTATGGDRDWLKRMLDTLERMRDCAGIRGRDPVPASGHHCG
jgi:N-acetylglucosamine-6-sulfatase